MTKPKHPFIVIQDPEIEFRFGIHTTAPIAVFKILLDNDQSIIKLEIGRLSNPCITVFINPLYDPIKVIANIERSLRWAFEAKETE